MMHAMDTAFALSKVGGSREKLAELLGVAPITTYHWQPALPPKHIRYLRVLKPAWFVEWERKQKRSRR